MNEALPAGVLDTSVVIALGSIDPDELPEEQAVTTITLGELSVGPLVADDPDEQARRQARLQATEHQFADALVAYDDAAARVFGKVMADALRRGRSSRVRVSEYQIAAIAIANGLALYTSNVDDFAQIDGLDLRAVSAPTPGHPTTRSIARHPPAPTPLARECGLGVA
jgi:tRNA(fMet)-specific endonuclease VapC